MTKDEARRTLNAAKDGAGVSKRRVTTALRATGDLHPWERDGHRFFVPGFPPGYVPEHAREQPKGVPTASRGKAWRAFKIKRPPR